MFSCFKGVNNLQNVRNNDLFKQANHWTTFRAITEVFLIQCIGSILLEKVIYFTEEINRKHDALFEIRYNPHSAARNAEGQKLCFKFINDSSSCYRNAIAARQRRETRGSFTDTFIGTGC